MRRHGVTIIYLLVAMTALVACVSLAADYARVQLVKTELQRTADAAARFAATAIPNGPDAVRAAAKAVALENSADAQPVVLTDGDIQLVAWNFTTRTYTVLTGANEVNANAVRVLARRVASRGTAVPTVFAGMVGRSNCDATCTAIATLSNNVDEETSIPATCNPWLAGMPSGTVANPGNPAGNPDYAPSASPKKITGVPIVPGQALTFDSIDGGANNFSSATRYTPDGNTDWIIDNWGNAEHGKSNIYSPINAVIGVFLSDAKPSTTAAPADLDFSSAASRDFTTLQPKLKQTFFIGDGRRADGTVQRFIVPPGATRLYIGTMDGWEWNNNVGGYTVTVHRVGQVNLVQ